MAEKDLFSLLARLRNEPDEREWLEFKDSFYDPQTIGEYLSALANGACLAGESRGYLVFGIEDKSHEIVGTRFYPYREKARGNQDLIIWLSSGLDPKVGFNIHELNHPKGHVVIFEIISAWDRPIKFHGKAFIRVGASKTELYKYPEKERAIWTRRIDWSAMIREGASIEDLDAEAIKKAREQFMIKHPNQASEVKSWDDVAFLNKCKLTIHNAITNTALILLGKQESSALLSPVIMKMTWILKDLNNNALDYEHFAPPILLQVDRILARIRNLIVRALPSGTLFPQEISQYDPWVLREALHNAIAHQDYGLGGRINIVEMPSSILIENVGGFLPGDLDTVICQDAPLEIYRNPFLAEAMVNLNMIDTQGGGIKRMFEKQKQRFFPMPDYDLSNSEKVKVTIPGNILNENYSRLLMERADLDLWQVILLDRVQKRQRISIEAHRALKSVGLVEGRYPNIIIASKIAGITGEKAKYIRDRGFNKKYYLDMIETLIKEHQPIQRSEIDRLLLDKLPEVLTTKQKKAKIHNLMAELVSKNKIENRGSKANPAWYAMNSLRSNNE